MTQDDLEKMLQSRQPVIARKGAPAPDTDPFKRHAKSVGFAPPIDAEARLRAMRWKGPGDTAIHQTQLQVTASLLERGLGVDEVVERVLDATREAVDGRPDWNWDSEDRKVRGMCETWHKKHPPKPEKKHKPPPKRPGRTTPLIFATGEPTTEAQVDRRDDPEPAGAQIHSLAVARAERDVKKGKGSKNTHVVLGRGVLDTFAERGEQVLYEGGRAHRYWNRDAAIATSDADAEARRAWSKVWQRMPDEQEREWLNAEIQRGCDALELTSRNALVSEVRGWLRRQPELQREHVPWDQHGMIATRSGMFDSVTRELRPTRPEDYATHRVECEYDPEAKCPTWLRMLADCTPNAKTAAVIQEVAGASLVTNRARELRRALVLTGPSNTGKSTVINVLAGMLSDSPNTTPLDLLENAHGTVDFLRPAPWVLHEAFDQSKWHFSATVKALLSGDPINVNIKNGPLIPHQYRGATMWSTNTPPQFKEASRAFEHRLLIVKLHKKFDPKNATGVAAEAYAKGYSSAADLVLDTERPGILNWALEGWARLKKRGHFEQTEEMLEAAHEMHLEHNLIAGMVEDLVDFDPDHMVAAPNFQAAFATWWRENRGEKVPSPAAVGKALRSYDDSIGVDNKELRYNGRRYYAGVSLNDDGCMAWQTYLRIGGLDLNIDANVEAVNHEIPPEWMVKDVIKRVRKAHRE